MRKLNYSKYFLFIAVFTFLAMFFYVVQNSYINLIEPVKVASKNPILKPIDTKMDITILDEIKNRFFFIDSAL